MTYSILSNNGLSDTIRLLNQDIITANENAAKFLEIGRLDASNSWLELAETAKNELLTINNQ